MKINKFLTILDEKIPFKLSEKWDNCGLLIGNLDDEIIGIVSSLELNENVINYAIENKFNLIVVHHPILFKPINNIKLNEYQGKLISLIIKNNLNVIALHTNFDKSKYNPSYLIANILELTNIKPLLVTDYDYLYKIAVFVPPDDCAKLKNALAEAGAGILGNYSHCGYMSEGYGEFMGNENSNPTIGEPLKLERTKEIKLEMVFNEKLINKIKEAMFKNHPYEEPAYDIYKLEIPCMSYGYGIIGDFKTSITIELLVEKLKKYFKSLIKKDISFICTGNKPSEIKRVAIVNGSGFDFYKNALNQKCDLIISGDLSYHKALEIKNNNFYAIDCTHFLTEFTFSQQFDILLKELEIEYDFKMPHKYNYELFNSVLELI